jgi:hypothetical protein
MKILKNDEIGINFQNELIFSNKKIIIKKRGNKFEGERK